MEIAELAAHVFPHVPERQGLEAQNWRPIIDQFEWNYNFYRALGDRLDRTCVTGVLEREQSARPSTYGPQWLGPIDIVTISCPRAVDLAATVGAVTEWEAGSVHEAWLPTYRGARTGQEHWSLVVPVEEITSDLVVETLRRFEIRFREDEQRRVTEVKARSKEQARQLADDPAVRILT